MASIVKRNNKYYVVYLYTDGKGNRKQKWESFKTSYDAKKRQKEIEYKEQIGTFVIPQCSTLNDLLNEYVSLYGKNKWALSTYSSNVGLIKNYITPFIGFMRLRDITPRVLEKYYQRLLKTRPVDNPITGKPSSEFVGTSTIRDVHKLLRNCFGQAVKWELMEKNPALNAIVPKHKKQERDIWTAETMFHAIELCKDERLKLAINLAFSCSLRIGELLGLTWDCVDITEEAINTGYASVSVNKELQRVTKSALETLEKKDVLYVFPTKTKRTSTVLVLKAPKTEGSVRKIFLPRTVAQMLISWKEEQDFTKNALGSEYTDYNLVVAGPTGFPVEHSTISGAFKKLIEENDLPSVVFHSLRHSSITYKLKLNGGDVKSVQGDSGHSQTAMVTDVYSHILDDDRRVNALLFEDAFYGGRGAVPDSQNDTGKLSVPEGFDTELLTKLLSNPEAVELLKALTKSL
jgi:integrase